MPSVSVVPAAVTELLTLFETDLEGVSFPDVDRAKLQSQVDQCNECALAANDLAAQLEAAREQLAVQQAALAALSKKAIAYARVYGAEDAELSEKLAALVVDKRRTRGGKKRAGAVVGGERRGRRAAGDAGAAAADIGEKAKGDEVVKAGGEVGNDGRAPVKLKVAG